MRILRDSTCIVRRALYLSSIIGVFVFFFGLARTSILHNITCLDAYVRTKVAMGTMLPLPDGVLYPILAATLMKALKARFKARLNVGLIEHG